jgi:hypothetical protein
MSSDAPQKGKDRILRVCVKRICVVGVVKKSRTSYRNHLLWYPIKLDLFKKEIV